MAVGHTALIFIELFIGQFGFSWLFDVFGLLFNFSKSWKMEHESIETYNDLYETSVENENENENEK